MAMKDDIQYHADLLAGRVRELLARPPIHPSERRKIPMVSGVYLFREVGEGHLYVGVPTSPTDPPPCAHPSTHSPSNLSHPVEGA